MTPWKINTFLFQNQDRLIKYIFIINIDTNTVKYKFHLHVLVQGSISFGIISETKHTDSCRMPVQLLFRLIHS